ncbi:Hypothetical protein, putative transcriptional regulator, MarR family [Mycoplasmopsis bovigenitalium 51080]|uniref:HTH marR-type domain-containing protein n=1 Tax=Mycoplasmopsis bovigenitalium 51080 TaxID=1188235 RepID=N9VEX7_9BACT|nr:MarR family transcriptional regulator [Mycoplasmopsis bovigenitalium]ENY69971.1 Hypothetical protein, putative transcriptional regulator, MarR family [Mycoplasmopsis bovigenitalium 51080]
MSQNLESSIRESLQNLVTSFDKKINKIVLENKITLSQFMVLEALYLQGDMCISQVRDLICSSVGTIPIIINNLEKANLIKRVCVPCDKRMSKLELTNEGWEVISRLLPINKSIIKNSFKNLSEDEKKQLLYLLNKIEIN